MARVTDPHPSNEEHPYRERRPGGAETPRGTTQRVNETTMTAPLRPNNVENHPPEPPAVDDNLDDTGRDVNSGKVDDKRHPQ